MPMPWASPRHPGPTARAATLVLGAGLLWPFAAVPAVGQTADPPWRLSTFADGQGGRAELAVVDHVDPGGSWLESRAWVLDPNGRRLVIGVTGTLDDGSILTSLRLDDVSARWSFEMGRELRGLTVDGTAFDDVGDLLTDHTLTRLLVTLRTNGIEQDLTAPTQLLNHSNEGERHRAVFFLLDASELRQLTLGEPVRRSLVFVQDTACEQFPPALSVFCDEVVPALLRGREPGATSLWTVADTVSFASGEDPGIQRVLRSFPRRDRRTRYDVRERE